ncbi:MAG: YbbR-like domain-containing protein, partial [Bacteroides graminisolvens]
MFRLRNIKCLYLKSIRRIKGFLLSDKSREFLIFLFFYFIASAFWLLQTLNNDYETEFSIPVRLRGVPDNVMLTTEPPAEIKIKVKDKGTVLLNYMLGKSFLPITLNFPLSKTTSSRVKVNWAEIEKQVIGQLGASTRLLAVNPDTLEYYFSTGKSKKVPVRLIGKLTPARQYYIADTLFSPDSVLVYAPPFILDTLTAAYT